MSPKWKAIIAHIGLIGWVIVIIINSTDQAGKDELSSFYLRQTLGIYLVGLIGSIIPLINIVVGIVVFIMWLLSLISAINGEMKETPYLGSYFQEWFKGVA